MPTDWADKVRDAITHLETKNRRVLERAEQPVRLCLGKHNGLQRILHGIGELGGLRKSVANAAADFYEGDRSCRQCKWSC
jgi:hypothetical protein